MTGDLRTNALDDLLDAERHFRSQAENTLRELYSVLTEQALRMAGTQIEDARRIDPGAPQNWGPVDWRKFFASLPERASSESWYASLVGELERLKGQNRLLQGKLAALEAAHLPTTSGSLAETDSRPTSIQPLVSDTEPPTLPQPTHGPHDLDAQGLIFTHQDLLRDLRELRLPPAPPARFENHFPKTGLNAADRERQVRRKLYVLYLLSRGLDIRLEIDYLISQVEGIGSRTGALRRIYDNMVEKNLIDREVLEMSAPNTSLAMLELTEDGRQLCQVLGWELNESERQRMNRLHQGVQYPQHTLAVMIFAMHARLRRYSVGVLPQLEGVLTNSVPDVRVSRNLQDDQADTIFVEVEMSSKELDAKWRNMAQLQGRVALCARNVQRRVRLIGDCKLKNLHGLATDLETLISCKVPDISLDTPLWCDEW